MSTLGASAEMAHDAGRTGVRGVALAVLPLATAIVLLAVALMLLFAPPWVHFAVDASGGAGWAPSPTLAHEWSDRTIAELLLGPGTFAISTPGGGALYTADEAAHLRDVRLVLVGFLALALAAGALVGWRLQRHRGEPATWRALARGGAALAVGLLVIGVIAAVAFGAAFELFHRLLFPGGNWAFPADSNLVRLYPLGFWQLSAAALGGLGIAGGALTWLVGRRRARALEAGR
jgi:hypothetical protein